MKRHLPRLLAIALAVASISVSRGAPAELVVRRATVITVDTNQPRAEAFAVSAGKFVMVGSERAVAQFIGPGTKVLDLPGKTVVPGFIDAHAHPNPEYPEESPWAPVDC